MTKQATALPLLLGSFSCEENTLHRVHKVEACSTSKPQALADKRHNEQSFGRRPPRATAPPGPTKTRRRLDLMQAQRRYVLNTCLP